MARLYALLLIFDIVLAVYALIDCLVTPGREIRALPKTAWVFLLVLFWPFAWIAWLLLGRASSAPHDPETSHPAGRGRRGKPRPLAPDDDPDFLRGLAQENTGPPPGPTSSPPPPAASPPTATSPPAPPRPPARPAPPVPSTPQIPLPQPIPSPSPDSDRPLPLDKGSVPLSAEDEKHLQRWEADLRRGDNTPRDLENPDKP